MGKKQKNKLIAESPELSSLADDLDEITAIAVVENSEGGKLIVKGLMSDLVRSVDTIAMKYDSLSHIEFAALGASIKTKLDTVRVIKRSPTAKKEIKEMLEEALQE